MTLVKFKKQAPVDVFNNFFDNWNAELSNLPRYFNRSAGQVNITESETAFTLEFQVPGFAKDELKVKQESDTLTVTGEVKTETETKERNYKRREFVQSSFSRSFTLPDTIDGDKIEAKHENGILNIILPKKVNEKQSNVREISLN